MVMGVANVIRINARDNVSDDVTIKSNSQVRGNQTSNFHCQVLDVVQDCKSRVDFVVCHLKHT